MDEPKAAMRRRQSARAKEPGHSRLARLSPKYRAAPKTLPSPSSQLPTQMRHWRSVGFRPIADATAALHAAKMSGRSFTSLIAVVLVLPLLCGNRSVPKWQASRNAPLASTERCVGADLARFGQVKVERGARPEAGMVRLLLLRGKAGKLTTAATIYMNGVEGFSALWMDATSKRLGNTIWRHVKRNCRLR